MAQIKPFRALRYDPARLAVSQAVTQPYDKITPEMQERYYAASPYNLVRIILGNRLATDGPRDNPYTRARAYLTDWRQDGIFLQDPEPSIYRYTQAFSVPGGTAETERQGFIAVGKIEDYSRGVVFRHEQTLPKPKADRLDLLRATSAHFGQIFMLYSDPERLIESALKSAGGLVTEVADEYGVRHRLWRVSDAALIAGIQKSMADKQLIIADGHHRYETALAYRDERRMSAGPQAYDESAAYEYVMMTFVNMDSPGLLVLPTHRVIHGLHSFCMEKFREDAGNYFTVDEVDPKLDARRATAILKEAAHTGTSLLAIARKRVFLLSRPKSPEAAFHGLSIRQQALDVVQLHRCILEYALGISEEAIRNQVNISYVRDTNEAMVLAREGRADVAFLMNPVRIQQIKNIAFAGEVLPQKSTDFYPKLLSGFTIYALE